MFMNGTDGLSLYSNLCHHCGYSPFSLFKLKKFYRFFKLCRVFRLINFSGVRYLAFDSAHGVGYLFGRTFDKRSGLKGFKRFNLRHPFACLSASFGVFRHKFGKARGVGFGVSGTYAGTF
jgi:hypothetical protein